MSVFIVAVAAGASVFAVVVVVFCQLSTDVLKIDELNLDCIIKLQYSLSQIYLNWPQYFIKIILWIHH